MKSIPIIYFIVSVLTLIPAGAQAQESGILVRDVKVCRNGTNVDVSCVFDLNDLRVKSNKSITYTPIITRGGRLKISIR